MGRASILSLHERDQIQALSAAGYTQKQIVDVVKRLSSILNTVVFEASMPQVLRISLMLIVSLDAVRRISPFRGHPTFQVIQYSSFYDILPEDTRNL
uniref:HTH_Tnp_Tc3_1 domain-containing protein n=1 Tax=Heterorhabditis bacteriophora TaxID=37862 RepID=A0A1I7XPX9_HETBA